jgi:hypothetical protein
MDFATTEEHAALRKADLALCELRDWLEQHGYRAEALGVMALRLRLTNIDTSVRFKLDHPENERTLRCVPHGTGLTP